jgi:mannose-binding lectin 2
MSNVVIEISFKIYGRNGAYAEGMAIWLIVEPGKQGPVFGMKDEFEGLGVFMIRSRTITIVLNLSPTLWPY